MASGPTGAPAHPAVVAHALDASRLDEALALSAAAGWNQDAADWLLMLSAGRAWGVSLADGPQRGLLVASTLVLPYPPRFAWISMVLVLPACRGQGHASRLLRIALADLRAHGLAPVLDATPAGAPVYRREGFADTWGFTRWQRSAGAGNAASVDRQSGAIVPAPTPILAADWPALETLDARAFGAGRGWLLRALARRRPQDALLVRDAEGVAGFVLARDGRLARQIGPLVARRADVRTALLDAALASDRGPVFVDAVDADPALAHALRLRGFTPQRPFVRMTRDAMPAPGEAGLVALVAGPELG